MGLFGKLKANFNHGGVKVQIQAPSSVPANQVIPVAVSVTADGPQTINGVKAEIKAQVREQGVTMGGGRGVGVQAGSTTNQTVAQVENREVFTLGPGETKVVNLELYMNGNVGNNNPLLGQMGGDSPLGNVLQTAVSAVQGFEHINYIYSVHATADVEGIALDPSDSMPIQILPPAQAAQPMPNPTVPAPQQPGQMAGPGTPPTNPANP